MLLKLTTRTYKEEQPGVSAPPKARREVENPHPDILRWEQALCISRCPWDEQHLALYLPFELVPGYLATVKNMHGRRWNPQQLVWEVPYTKLTLRFIEKYIPESVLKWSFTPGSDVPERLPEPERAQRLPEKVIPARYEAAVVALEEVLTLKRYSWRTIKSYKSVTVRATTPPHFSS